MQVAGIYRGVYDLPRERWPEVQDPVMELIGTVVSRAVELNIERPRRLATY